jgi:glycerate dehydrogenase
MQEIVVTDGFTLNPGDLDWSPFRRMGNVTLYDRSSKDEIISRCEKATVIVTNKTPIDRQTIAACQHLKLIAVTATGYNIIDVESAKEMGVNVCNVPAYGTDSVAQHTFALILELTNHVGANHRSVQEGGWFKSKDWCYTTRSIIELSGKTLGIVGFGNIGRKVANIGAAFGMNIIFSNPSEKIHPFAKQVSRERLFAESDVVSLHLPLKNDSYGFVNEELLSLMKPSAFLINTSRGQLINEEDLSHFLKQNQIAGAALDVLSQEPPAPGHPLVGLSNCIITPHNAWLSFEARQRMLAITLANIESFLRDTPQNLVS